MQPLHDIAHQTGGRLAAADGERRRAGTNASPTLLDLLAEPTVVVIEDVHWADEATLDLLVFLGRRLADTPSVLVLTFRERTPDPPPRLAEVLGHLARSARTAARLACRR